jgi:acetyl-CoA acetyltransferase
MKAMRFMHDHGVKQEALRAIAMASYHHAQSNPRAVMYGKPLDEAKYDASRWIVEPFHLFDCCMENDGAAAIIMVPAERAKDFPNKPVYVLGAASGSDYRCAAQPHNTPNYASSSFATVAPNLYKMAGVGPKDVGVVQSYENFTGGVLMALAEHGFFKPEEANEFLTLDNLLAPSGKLPINTSGGNLAECYMHGFELVLEAVRQVRGQSTAQAPRSDVAMVIGGPMVTPVSNLILGSQATL